MNKENIKFLKQERIIAFTTWSLMILACLAMICGTSYGAFAAYGTPYFILYVVLIIGSFVGLGQSIYYCYDTVSLLNKLLKS